MKVEYKNRYGDVHTFTKTEDGNILWEGNFEYSRSGCPNVYTYYSKVFQFLSQMYKPTSGIGSPAGLADAIKNNTSQVFSAIKKDWSNIITLKLAPIYKARVDAYAVAPVQK